MATKDEALKLLWSKFISSVALADHLGDVAEDVRELGELLGLPVPGRDASLDAPRDCSPEESWGAFADSIGAAGGSVYDDEAKAAGEAYREAR